MKDNDNYIDLMESYFEKTGAQFYEDPLTVKDINPDCHYQVGATPENIEKARDHSDKFE